MADLLFISLPSSGKLTRSLHKHLGVWRTLNGDMKHGDWWAVVNSFVVALESERKKY